jgi:hypothetical protein
VAVVITVVDPMTVTVLPGRVIVVVVVEAGKIVVLPGKVTVLAG